MSESTQLPAHRFPTPRRRAAMVAALPAFALLLALGLAGCGQEEVPILAKTDSAASDTNDAAAAEATKADEAAESVAEPDSTIADAGEEAESTIDAGEAEPAATMPNDAAAGPPGSGLATGRPYVVIRFPESSVDYEEELATAVRRALERRPHVAFDLVAVTPRASTAEDLADDTERARQQAAEVLDFLSSLGIGADRVSVGAWTGQPTKVNEIRLYIR